MGRAVTPPTRRALAMAVIENPFAGRFEENLGRADRDRRGARRPARRQVRRGAGHCAGCSAKLRQGRDRSARPASSNMRPRVCIPSSVRRCAGRSRRVRHSCLPRRSAVAWAPRSTCRSATRTPPSCAATSTRWKRACRMRPRANEIVVAVVVTDSGRPLPRVGGLQAHEIKGEDGLR